MLLLRMYRAALLDRKVYDELRNDPVGFAQGLTVVILATVALLIGAFVEQAGSGDNVVEALSALIAMPGVWLMQAVSAYVLGSMAIPAENRQALARPLMAAIGLSAAPGLLFLFLGAPEVGPFVGFVVTLWMVITMVVAVQWTLGIPGFRATMAVLPGFVLRFIVIGVLFGGSGGAA